MKNYLHILLLAITLLSMNACVMRNGQIQKISFSNSAIQNMQDETGYFYFRKYPGFYNKTETLHWGQATMFSSLSALLTALSDKKITE